MSDYQNKPKEERVKSVLDDAKYAITAPPPNGAKRPAKLVWQIWENNPRMVVFTGVEGDNLADRIQTAAMDSQQMESFFSLLEDFAKAEEGKGSEQFCFTLYRPADRDAGRGAPPNETARIVVKRNSNEVITLSIVVPKSEVRVGFEFKHRLWSASEHNNDKMVARRMSTYSCIGWINALRSVLRHKLASEWTHIERKPYNGNKGDGRGNYGGGGNRGGYGGGNGGRDGYRNDGYRGGDGGRDGAGDSGYNDVSY